MAKQVERMRNMSKVVTDKRPCFFKIILPGITTEHMVNKTFGFINQASSRNPERKNALIKLRSKERKSFDMSDHEETDLCRFKKFKDEKINQSKILKDGRADSLNSTYFQKRLASYNVQKTFILSIPAAFAKRNLPRIKTKVTLRNSEGKYWVVNFHPNEGNNPFSGGLLA